MNDASNIYVTAAGRYCKPCYLERRYGNQANGRRALKVAAFDAYGGPTCYCCGESEMGFLTIEHLNDDGAAHRQETGGGSHRLYQWLKEHGYPQDLGLAVACFNCNSGRAANGGVCPHQTR